MIKQTSTLGFLVLAIVIYAQSFATLNIYCSKKPSDKLEASFVLLLNNSKTVAFKSGERVSVKILNPNKLNVKVRNRSTGFSTDTEFEFLPDKTYFWEFSNMTQYILKENSEAISQMKNFELFSTDSVFFVEIDASKSKPEIITSKTITVSEVYFGKDYKEEAKEPEINERPAPVGAKEIDNFVNKAFDIYETTKDFSDKIHNINTTLAELTELQAVEGNPVKQIKKEAMVIEKYIQLLKRDSEGLIKMSPDVLNGAKKVKFTKVAAATKNIKSSIEAVKWSLVVAGELVNDLPKILMSIGDFEKKHNIVDTEVILDDFIQDSDQSENINGADGSLILTINESELHTIVPAPGQIVFTKDTKKLLFFDGTNFKKIIFEDL
ncbi:MAG: hypothetical protein AB7V07_02670 [Candidatus Delongbacteria bacterium]